MVAQDRIPTVSVPRAHFFDVETPAGGSGVHFLGSVFEGHRGRIGSQRGVRTSFKRENNVYVLEMHAK